MEQLNGAQQVVRVLEDLGVTRILVIQVLLLQIFMMSYMTQRKLFIH